MVDKDKALDALFGRRAGEPVDPFAVAPPQRIDVPALAPAPEPDDDEEDEEDDPPAPSPIPEGIKGVADVAALPPKQPAEPTVKFDPENPNMKKLDIDPDREELAKYFLGEELFTRFKLLALGRGINVPVLLDQGLQLAFDSGAFECLGAREYQRSAQDDRENHFENRRLRNLVGGLYDQVLAACRAHNVRNREGFAAGIEAALDRGAI